MEKLFRIGKLCSNFHFQYECIKLIIDSEVIDNNWAIKYASENGHADLVKLLIDFGKIDVTVENNYTIRFASDNGHSEIIKLLLLTGKIDVKKITDKNI